MLCISNLFRILGTTFWRRAHTVLSTCCFTVSWGYMLRDLSYENGTWIKSIHGMDTRSKSLCTLFIKHARCWMQTTESAAAINRNLGPIKTSTDIESLRHYTFIQWNQCIQLNHWFCKTSISVSLRMETGDQSYQYRVSKEISQWATDFRGCPTQMTSCAYKGPLRTK